MKIYTIPPRFAPSGVAFVLALLLPASEVYAEVPTTDDQVFSLSGFATLGAVHSSERNADYTYTIFQPKGAGYTEPWSLAVDSRVALQLNAKLSRQWSGVLQVISEQQYDGTFRPAIEWANVTYQATPDLSLRVGRIALASTLSSDYRKVGYAMPWIRPPRDVYSLAPVTNNDGIDLRYRSRFGAVSNTVQAYVGRKDLKTTYQDGEPIQVREAMGVTDTVEFDAATLRMTYQQARLTMPASKSFFDQLRQFGTRGVALADQYDFENKRYRLLSIGANYDPGNWFITSEWERVQTHSWSGDGTGWFIGGGVRLGRWTPYMTYSRARLDSPSTEAGLSTAGLPPAYAFAAGRANAVLNSLLGNFIPTDRTIAVGTRWDVARNAALKVQLEHISVGSNSNGTFRFPRAGFTLGGQANIVSIALDMVF